MSPRIVVRGLFLGSAICLVIQIAQERALPPGVLGDQSWGDLGLSAAVVACGLLAREM